MKRILMAGALCLGMFAVPQGASAAPIVGEINIAAAPGGGGVQATGGTAWATATGLEFIVATVAPYLGFSGAVTTTTADFNAYAALGVMMMDFTFNPFPGGGVVPLWTLAGGSFHLLTLDPPVQDATSIDLSGTGTFFFAGYDPTPGEWEFTSQTAGGSGPTFSFSSTQVSQVPEPAMLALLGFGLMGVARRYTRR